MPSSSWVTLSIPNGRTMSMLPDEFKALRSSGDRFKSRNAYGVGSFVVERNAT